MEDVKEAVIQNPEIENPVEEADAGSQQDSVSLNEILSGAQDNEAVNPAADSEASEAETVANLGDDAPAQPAETGEANEPTVYRNQDEFNAAFSRRMAREREMNRPFIELGRAVTDATGGELTADEVNAALNTALADKRSKANKTDYDTEMNNIRLEQRVAKRFAPQPPAPQEVPAADETVQQRTSEMLAAIQAIGDSGFTVEALQGNQNALAEWVSGATPAQVYRKYFLAGTAPKPAPEKRPSVERRANGGATGKPEHRLTAREIAAIDAAIDANKTIRL